MSTLVKRAAAGLQSAVLGDVAVTAAKKITTNPVPRSRLLDLMKVQCNVFSTTYNPERLRTGNKILRQRLKGPAVAAYYPRKVATVQMVQKIFKEIDLETWDEDEEERREHLQIVKARGKGAPKKKRTAAESKKLQARKRT